MGHGQWDIPKLHLLLEKIVPEQGVMEGYEVEHEFPEIGQRTMLLNARKVFYERGSHTTILLGIEDITAARALEREKDELARQKDELLEQKVMLGREFDHRLLNSLQLISSLLSLQSRTTKNPEAAEQLSIAGNRVAALGRVHRRLHVLDHVETVEFKAYASRLCEDLSGMLHRERRAIVVEGDDTEISTVLGIPLGFIVNELVTNSIKYGTGTITVRLEVGAGREFALDLRRRAGPAGRFRGVGSARAGHENHPVACPPDRRRTPDRPWRPSSRRVLYGAVRSPRQ